jgi:hypothetical protein
MLTCTANEDRSPLPADHDLRNGPLVELGGEVLKVLADTSLPDVEALGVPPEGDIPADALGQRTQLGGKVRAPCKPAQKCATKKLVRYGIVLITRGAKFT